MFSGLRLRLTLVYLLSGLALTAIIGGGAYFILRQSLQSSTDQALDRKLTLVMQKLEPTPTPPAATPSPTPTDPPKPAPTAPAASSSQDGENESEAPSSTKSQASGSTSSKAHEPSESDLAFDAGLAPVFVTSLDSGGQQMPGASPSTAPVPPDPQAVAAAQVTGRDLRTISLPDGTRYRLMTLRLVSAGSTIYLQAGRSLADQDQTLASLLTGLLVLAVLVTLAIGLASWWLAGRSLIPAERAWEQQQALVANASHELRAPLTVLRATAELAQRQVSGQGGDGRPMDDILRDVDHMNRVVEDLLLLSRLDAGRLPIEPGVVPVGGLLWDAQRQFAAAAEARDVTIGVATTAGSVWADAVRLRQVLVILLDNALRHTPAGGRIDLRARTLGRQVEIVVADTGTGIAPEHLPRVFERFYRGDADASDEGGGSGLGLSIARSLVEAQQGRIDLESRPEVGTRAVVQLPAAPRHA
jgi:signal transduction histidine kinase